MPQFVYYLPLFTFNLSITFAVVLINNMLRKGVRNYLLWWMIGMLTYGAGTLTESINTLFGWHELNFKLWYITGALLGGAPLAQGTVYLLLKKKTADILTAIFILYVLLVSTFVFLSPIEYEKVNALKLSGKVFTWQWIRMFSPFVNTYALIFLAGGAIYSAYLYFKRADMKHRFYGNTLIAIGAILPGIGGTSTRFGHVEILYITELVGLLLIFLAYLLIKKGDTIYNLKLKPLREDDTGATLSNIN